MIPFLPPDYKQKKAAVHLHGSFLGKTLFCVLHSAALADHIDLDLAGVIQRVLDLLGNGAGQQDDLIVADDVGLDHDADLTACLHGKGLLDALKAGRDLLQVLQALDIALHVLTAGTRAGSADGVADKKENGEFDLHREGGHSEFRILHHKDNTGAEIQLSLIEAIKRHPNITIFNHHFAVEIITQHHLGIIVTRHTPGIKCYGAYVLNEDTGKVDTFLSKVTVMATGGCEAVYRNTTNPLIATGDGIAMVYRAKGAVKNMEFIQFHPTALFHPGDRPCFLITEAMRGYGGVLRTLDGKEFMQKYDKRLSLAPRDIVARAIDNEMKLRGEDHVYLDVTHKDPEETKKHFPNIYKKCLSIGIDITKDYIPVAPAAHYLCGGISVDLNGQSSIRRLYAIGECSCTGLHGGNRLASNSLIEAVVYADAAAKHILSVLCYYSSESTNSRRSLGAL